MVPIIIYIVLILICNLLKVERVVLLCVRLSSVPVVVEG